MKMRRREPVVYGPRRAEDKDVDPLNKIFADAFTDRYRRDGLVGVRVPQLNPEIWRYALRDAGAGAMLWCDDQEQILAFNIAHHSGVEGWMGPLAVRTDGQGCGIGRLVVTQAIDWLRGQRVQTIGLETMPRTVDNIGFYSRLGFLPGHLTVTLIGEIKSRRGPAGEMTLLSTLSNGDRDDLVDACRTRLARSAPGHDYTREINLTNELRVGDTIVIGSGGIRGFALWHSSALVEARPAEELRLLKLFADSQDTLLQLIDALENCAVSLGLRRVAIRCQTTYTQAYAALIQRGYGVRWTDLRMTLAGYPGVVVADSEVLWSNWEI